jgi:hypothetical protein
MPSFVEVLKKLPKYGHLADALTISHGTLYVISLYKCGGVLTSRLSSPPPYTQKGAGDECASKLLL